MQMVNGPSGPSGTHGVVPAPRATANEASRVMLPPLATALMPFRQANEASWHTPGHTGGTAFLKSPVGRVFFDYFGGLRSDLSVSVAPLGSLLDPPDPSAMALTPPSSRHRCPGPTGRRRNRVIFTRRSPRRSLCDRNCQVHRARLISAASRHISFARNDRADQADPAGHCPATIGPPFLLPRCRDRRRAVFVITNST
jgi:hypothetical protein